MLASSDNNEPADRAPVAMSIAEAPAPEQCFAGSGEMAQQIRAFDWAKTPLGPASGWSPALRSTVGLLIHNRFPLLLWWGPQFVQIYNDAYRPIPGASIPSRSDNVPASAGLKSGLSSGR